MASKTQCYIVEINHYGRIKGHTFKPVCDTNERKILSEATTKPESFSKVKGDKVVNHIFGGADASNLKEGVAQIKRRGDIISIAYGHGGMLGGMDTEVSYHPLQSSKVKKAKALWNEFERVQKASYTDEMLEEFVEDDKSKSKLSSCFRTEKMEEPVKKNIRRCLKDKKNLKLSGTQTSALVKGGCKAHPRMKGVSKVEDAPNIEPKTLYRELKEFGYKKKDIVGIHCAKTQPSIIDLKDGNSILFATGLTEEMGECEEIMSEARITARERESKIQREIEQLLWGE